MRTQREFQASILAPEQLDMLITLFLYGRGEKGAQKAEIEALIAWAEQTTIQHGFLEAVLSGDMLPDMVDGEPQFRITPQGEAAVDQMVARGIAGIARELQEITLIGPMTPAPTEKPQ